MLDNWQMTRRQLLQFGTTSIAAAGVASCRSLLPGSRNNTGESSDNSNRVILPSTCVPLEEGCPLKDHAASRGLIYGAAAKYPTLSSDSELANVLSRECALLVPENDFKWISLRPGLHQFDFTRSDWMADFADANNLLLRGHTLVWYKSLPRWFQKEVNVTNAEAVMLDHIRTVGNRYAGRMHSWDVVNEAIAPTPTIENPWRPSPWLDWVGEDYVAKAFHAAHEVDPDARLVYNENGLWWDAPEGEAKKLAVLRLLENLKTQGVPVHALGIQSHLRGHLMDQFQPEKMRQFLQNVADLEIEIIISELDVRDTDLPDDIGERDRLIASAYSEYLAVILEQPAVSTVVTWGLSDRDTWHNKAGRKNDARPLPFDRNLNRKPAWSAISNSFQNAPLHSP